MRLAPEYLCLLFNSLLPFFFIYIYIMEIKYLKVDLFFFFSKIKVCQILPENMCDMVQNLSLIDNICGSS